jgi:hypothetical protein
MIEEDLPAMRVSEITVRARHYKAFTHDHPYEFDGVMGVQRIPEGVIVHGIESREVFMLDKSDIGPVHVDVTGLKRALATRLIPLVMYEAQLNQRFVDYTMKSNGCEEAGIARLLPRDLKRPGILIHWAGDHTTFVDGAHRLVRRWREGMTTFQFARVEFSEDVLRYVARPGGEGKFYENDRRKT